MVVSLLTCAQGSPAAERPNALAPSGEARAWRDTAAYTVLLPETPAVQEEYAARLLGDAIEKMTGVRLPVVREPAVPPGPFVSLGATRAATGLGAGTELKPDGYRIREQDGHWYFEGGQRRGPVNAVLAFMEEDLGWRDYSIFVPQYFPDWRGKALRAVPRAYSPPLEAREVHIREAWDPEWALRNRSTPLFTPTGPAVDQAAGGSPSYPPGGWFAHTFARLAPDAATFAAHPEYCAQKGDKRVPNDLCLSHPETVKIVAANVLTILDANPGAAFFSISQNDGAWAVCACPTCRALTEKEGSASAPVLNFVNQVAALVAVKYPQVKLSTLAYLETFRPPATIRPASNVIIFLATDRHMWANPFHFIDETEPFQQALRAWNDCGAQIHLWDYTFGDNAHWLNPSPNFDVLAYNLRFFLRQPGVTGVLFQDNYCSVGDSRGALKTWLLTKLLWNPNWDVAALERDFSFGYYGAAGEAMQAYNDLLRAEWQRYHERYRPADQMKFTVSDTFLPQAQELLKQAAAAVAAEPVRSREVEREAACLLYQRLEQGVRSPADREAYLADIERLRETCERLGISSFAESVNPSLKYLGWKLRANRPPVVLPTPNTIQFWLDTVSLPSVCGPATASIVEEAQAEAGYAILQPCPITHWSIQWTLTPASFLKAEGRYIVRVRAKLGAMKQPQGPVFHLGLYSGERGTLFQKDFAVADFTGDGYQWLQAATVEAPRSAMTLYIGPTTDSAAEAIYVDMVEMVPEAEWPPLRPPL
jgi:hypothetical protein